MATASASAQSYFFKSIDDPNATGPSFGVPPRTLAIGVNDSGVIVGSYSYGSNATGAFKYAAGSFSIISFPGVCGGSRCGSEVRGINNFGEAVGDYNDTSGNEHGYLLVNGSYTIFDFPGAQYTQPNGVNNLGVVVGIYIDANSVQHGFIYNGSFSTFECPTGGRPYLSGINDAGDLVGGCTAQTGVRSQFKFTASTGQFTTISFPGAFGTGVSGINNSGQMVGTYLNSSNNQSHGFVFSAGNYFTIDPPGSTSAIANAINNNGEIVGDYGDSGGAAHGFLATKAQLVDPVPDLLSGSAVRSASTPPDRQILATKGQTVQGTAADGVTEVVMRVPANNVGDQFLLTVLNDSSQAQSTLPDEDGALGNPGDATFSQTQLAITAVATSNDANNPNPMAFAVYRAPIDFARPISGGGYKADTCNGVSTTDDQAGCRTVTVTAQSQSAGLTANIPVLILRAPVVLIHGIWGSWSEWNTFGPLVTGPGTVDPRFSVGRVNYDDTIGASIVATDPFFPATQRNRIKANSLGFAYNAPNVLAQIERWITYFKTGKNPANVPVAGIQADIVAHSMGGVITRTLVLQPTFLSGNTFGQGNIHKVITIDTPHLGTPVAIQLLSPGEHNGCLQNLLASYGDFPLNLAILSNGPTYSGAIADLEGDDTTGALSNALTALNSTAPHPLPTALIAGIYQNFAVLDSIFDNAFLIRNWPKGCPSDPLAQQLTSSGWPAVFHNNANDAIVSEVSQLDGEDPSHGYPFLGYVHSPGTTKLGFSGPSVLDAGDLPTQVIFLLNKPRTSPDYYTFLAP